MGVVVGVLVVRLVLVSEGDEVDVLLCGTDLVRVGDEDGVFVDIGHRVDVKETM